MKEYQHVLDCFVQKSRDILDGLLAGVYLHGSAAMGCFHPQRSDLDLIIVTSEGLPNRMKRQYMDMAIALHQQAPAKGLEFSIVRAGACNPFAYPTPFELHFSRAHLDWYQSDPEDYVEKMKGTDRDLAAHCTILYHRGIVLYGKEIKEVFSPVRDEDYFDSIWRDIENARDEIADSFTYMTLNLCRVLAYKQERRILSKREGGQWGLAHVSAKYAGLIAGALAEYETGRAMETEEPLAKEFAGYMLGQIKPI